MFQSNLHSLRHFFFFQVQLHLENMECQENNNVSFTVFVPVLDPCFVLWNFVIGHQVIYLKFCRQVKEKKKKKKKKNTVKWTKFHLPPPPPPRLPHTHTHFFWHVTSSKKGYGYLLKTSLQLKIQIPAQWLYGHIKTLWLLNMLLTKQKKKCAEFV